MTFDRRRNRTLTCLLAVAILLPGCVAVSRPAPRKMMFVPRVGRTGGLRPRATDSTLAIAPVRAAALARTRALLYRTGERAFVADYYNELHVEPAELMGELARDWLAASGLFGGVVALGDRASGDLVLEGRLLGLYGDYTATGVHHAVCEAEFTLLRHGRPAADVLLQRRYAARAQCPTLGADGLVAAMEGALARVLTDLEADLAEALGG